MQIEFLGDSDPGGSPVVDTDGATTAASPLVSLPLTIHQQAFFWPMESPQHLEQLMWSTFKISMHLS